MIGSFIRRIKPGDLSPVPAILITVRVAMENGGTLEDSILMPAETDRKAVRAQIEWMRRSLDRHVVHIEDFAERWVRTNARNSANVTKCR